MNNKSNKIQKIIAQAGICSRRKAESLVLQGKVRINGKVAKIGDRAEITDIITVGNKKISAQKTVYIALNKPEGYVCTNRNFKGEKNVLDLVGEQPRLFVAGRLDKDSCGLILLTNDGDLCLKITHPRYEHKKIYEVEIKQPDDVSDRFIIKNFLNGINLEDGLKPARAEKIRTIGKNKFEIILMEGRNRQIRRMFAQMRCAVQSLKRTKLGKIELQDLEKGEWRYITKEDIGINSP